jgi:predicted NUDIX family NTP pyrophosphohydrolase
MRDPQRELSHRIRVFVYRYREGAPSYLLLRGAQFESFWTPIHGPIGFGEKLEAAIRREVMDDIGLARPSRLIDLGMPTRWQLGDEEVI